MSIVERRPLAEMLREAKFMAGLLRPACERIGVAGSIRRKRETVGDVEIVAIATPLRDLFGDPTGETEVDWLCRQQGAISLRKDGPRYKQIVTREGTQVDLFLATPDNWGYILMLRTGPAEFSKRMVTPKAYGGLLPNNLNARGGRLWFHGKAIEAPTERELFRLWGMEYIEPEDR